MTLTCITPELAWEALSPLTAFKSEEAYTENDRNHARIFSWNDSLLNPKNRIDSLSPSPHPKWRLDGCTSLGTQYFAVPVFFSPVIPLHIHTFIPPPSEWAADFRSELQIDSAFLYRDARIMNFGIAHHIVRTLDNWSSKISEFQSVYEGLPFGSQLVFENMERDIRKIRVKIVPGHDLERQLMSAAALESRLIKSSSLILPKTLDISRLHLVSQIQDSTSIVEVRVRGCRNLVVFKTLSDSPSYLYHELSLLLNIPSHPNIVSRPLNIVTKKVRFGSKIAVVGFTLPYLAQGSLRDALPTRRIQGSLRFQDQIKWASQVTQALTHVRDHGPGWYCDLRLDNVLLSDSNDAVLIDFEQRGVLPSFSPPEIRYLDYVVALAKDTSFDPYVQAEFKKLYEENVGSIIEGTVTDGYQGNESWLSRDKTTREELQVSMLGRLLWCIFEGVSAPQTEIWVEYFHEPDLEFPDFKLTPMELRPLIRRCTQDWDQDLSVVKRKGRWLKNSFGVGSSETEIKADVFRRTWKVELDKAKAFFKKKRLSTGAIGRSYVSLDAVLETLTAFQKFV
jgi:hypothetical protein